MTKIDLKGVHRVIVKLANGSRREYHYAWRKGPKFWDSSSKIKKGSAAYVAAFARTAPKAECATGKFRALLLRYQNSAEFNRLSERYKKDIRTSVNHMTNGIDTNFGEAPVEAFNDFRIRGKILAWRDRIGGKVGDDRVRHLQKIVAFGYDRGDLTEHHLRAIKTIYKSNRATILWEDAEIENFTAATPKHIGRILTAASETGLRPGDLVRLSRFHIQDTANGRRIVIRTSKKNRVASIPVTTKMAALIDETPKNQTIFLIGQRGEPYRHENYLGDAVTTWRDKIGLRKELRLYDARGTAATRLLNAGAEIREIATAMAWSIQQATSVIERYVALHPDMTDGLLAKIEKLRIPTYPDNHSNGIRTVIPEYPDKLTRRR